MGKTIPLRPANEQFTDSQWQAVFDGDENILVSASGWLRKNHCFSPPCH